MLRNFDGKVRFREIAAELNLSLAHFLKAFANSVGTPPNQWVLAQRIALSEELLLSDAATIAEIAAACGFSDQSHFHRTFIRATGLTPGEWRRMARQKTARDPATCDEPEV